MTIREGIIVSDKTRPNRIGVVGELFGHHAQVHWFIGQSGYNFMLSDEITPVENQDVYQFEAALALNDKVKLLELYRRASPPTTNYSPEAEFYARRCAELEEALTPFAVFGQVKHPYSDEATFTFVHDCNGRQVRLTFADFTRAASLLPEAQTPATDDHPIGAAGGIAEIMEQSS
jgi:hypothetical protein